MKETAKEAFERCLQNVSLEEKPDAEWVAQQYAVEQAGALAIKEAAPFSEERERITRQCYEMVDRLIQARSRQKGQSVAAYGAGESFVDLLDQLIRYLHTKSRRSTSLKRAWAPGISSGLCISSEGYM